jgi:hypothetical protein
MMQNSLAKSLVTSEEAIQSIEPAVGGPENRFKCPYCGRIQPTDSDLWELATKLFGGLTRPPWTDENRPKVVICPDCSRAIIYNGIAVFNWFLDARTSLKYRIRVFLLEKLLGVTLKSTEDG